MASYTTNYNLYKPAVTDPYGDFITEFGNNMDTIDANLGGGGGSSTLAGLSDVTLTTPVTDDALIYDGAEWVNMPLSAVAFSGSYTDLSNTPTIPTNTSDLINDSDFVSDASYVHTDNNFTNADLTKLSGIQAGAEVNVQSDWNEADNTADDYIKNKPTIPTNTSDLNNDSGFLDSSDITVTQIQSTGTKIATIDVDGNSTDLYAPTGGGSGGHTILDESGTALADEPNLQFTDGLKASDDSGNSKTKVGVDTVFTEAVTRANIDSGDTFSTILGKIKKWFADLPSMFLSVNGGNVNGSVGIISTNQHVLSVSRNNSSTVSALAALTIGDALAEGTIGACHGVIHLYGLSSYYGAISAANVTNHRSFMLPDASGTIALTSDVDGKVSKAGDTMTGDLTMNKTGENQIYIGNNHSNTSSQPASIYLGNSIPDGTVGSCYGRLRILGKGAYNTILQARNSTANRVIDLPDKTGIIALTDDLPTYNGSQIQLKIETVSIDIKNYTQYGGSIASGFGGQFLVFSLSSLQSAGFLTGFTRILSANIIYWAGTWRDNYPNGRLLIDGGATTIDIILGTNFVNTSCSLILSVIGY